MEFYELEGSCRFWPATLTAGKPSTLTADRPWAEIGNKG